MLPLSWTMDGVATASGEGAAPAGAGQSLSDRAETEAVRATPQRRPPSTSREEAGGPGLAAVLMPREHGVWGMVAEIVVLSQLVRPSWSGLLVAGAAVAAVLTRSAWTASTRVATNAAGAARQQAGAWATPVTGLAVVGCIAGAMMLSGSWVFVAPLLIALGPALVASWLAGHGGERDLATELLQAVAMTAVAPAAILAGGHDSATLALAAAAWGFLLVRQLTAIVHIRHLVRTLRARPTSVTPSLVLHAGAAAGVSAAALAGVVPWLVPAALGPSVLRLLATWTGLWRPAKAKSVGLVELALGVISAVIAATGLVLAI